MNFLEKRQEIISILKTCFDPELAVNIWDLGLIYGVNVNSDNQVDILLTLTSPTCPAADQIFNEIQEKVEDLVWVKELQLDLTWDPPWDSSLLSEATKLELGLL